MQILQDSLNVDNVLAEFPLDKETTEAEAHSGRIQRIKRICELAKVSYAEYVNAISTTKVGYAVVVRRDVNELYVNSYNREWMKAWNGNLDIQVCLDFFQVITYITDYYAKDDTGLSEILKYAKDNCKSKDLQEKMRTVANTFLRSRQIGEAEAVYRLIPALNLSMSNVTCQFVGTDLKHERSSRWRRADKHQIESGIACVELDKHEGLWYEQQDMWSKYLRRPDVLAEICFAQFAKMYKSATSTTKEDEDVEDDAVLDVQDDNEEEDVFESKFHYVMTCYNPGNRAIPLPDLIQLRHTFPGEPRLMQKRKRPAALRFHKSKKNKDPLRFMTMELMLYYPLTDEVQEDKILQMYNETHDDKRKVDIVKSQVMEFLEGIQEQRFMVEEALQKLDLQAIEEALDAQGAQDNDDCGEMDEEQHPDYQHRVPSQRNLNVDPLKEASIYRKIDVPTDAELYMKTRNLDYYQREVLNVGIKFCRDIVKARSPENTYPQAPFLMVSGGAGAGKSTLINVLAIHVDKTLRQEGESDCPCVLKASFTGCAASNIQGQTLSSLFSFAWDNKPRSLSDKNRDKKRSELQYLRLVIIDEVSMATSDLIYMLDLRLQEITEKDIPFGGVAVFCFGDMAQLKPVRGRFVYEEPFNTADFADTHAWAPRWQMFSSILLEENHRQGKDRAYADLLNKIRVGAHTVEDLQPVVERVRPLGHPDLDDADIWIAGTRKVVQKLNDAFMNKNASPKIELEAIHHHPTIKNFKPRIDQRDGVIGETGFQEKITLKVGAKVMLISNVDVIDGLTNGQFGELVDVITNSTGTADKLVVKPKDSSVGKNNRARFPQHAAKYPECFFLERVSHTYTISKRSGDVGSSATVIQFPIRLAFAVTCHKIQGQTISAPAKVVLDLNGCFAAAMAYVMLSRVQSIDQVYILDKLAAESIKCEKKSLEELQRLYNISLNNNPTPWNTEQTNCLKVASLNCAGLNAHYDDIVTDLKLLQATMLQLSETSITSSMDRSRLEIPNFHPFFTVVGNGKGIVTYCKIPPTKFVDYKGKDFQVSSSHMADADCIHVYRSSTASLVETCNAINKNIRDKRPTLITGDFNVCAAKNPGNCITTHLLHLGFTQLVNEATHIKGGHIDHVYWRDAIDPCFECPILERYSPYYSDHDALLITLTKKQLQRHTCPTQR